MELSDTDSDSRWLDEKFPWQMDLGNAHAKYELNDWVKLAGGWYIPQTITLVFPSDQDLPSLEMVIDSSDGVPRCSSLSMQRVDGGREVRTSDVRLVQIDNWIERVVAALSVRIERTSDGERVIHWSPNPVRSESELRAVERLVQGARRTSRRKITPELLSKVAGVYNAESSRGLQAVQLSFGVSKPTAARYVRLAREQDPPLIAPRETD